MNSSWLKRHEKENNKRQGQEKKDVRQARPIKSFDINCTDSKGSRDWGREIKERLGGAGGEKRGRHSDVGLSRGSQHAV